jgi:tetratricopeptide (TPR) repeat protein
MSIHALGRAERAVARLAEGGADEEVCERAERVREELRLAEREQEMVLRLEEARLKGAEVTGAGFDNRKRLQEYQEAFAWYLHEKDVRLLPAEEVVRRLAGSTIKAELAAALDDWSFRGETKEDKTWARTMASKLDEDPLREEIRQALLGNDREELRRLARSSDLSKQPPGTLVLLDATLVLAGETGEAERVLREAQKSYPGDFWINHDLGVFLAKLKPANKEDSVRFLTAAVSLRSLSPVAHTHLGNALSGLGRHREAEEAHRHAIKLQPDFALAHFNLGNALYRQGRHQEAEKAWRRAIKIQSDLAGPHSSLGSTLSEQGRFKEAEAACRQAIKLQPDFAGAHYNLGCVLSSQGRHKEAEEAYRRAIKLQPDFAGAHTNLGNVLSGLGRHKEAEEACRQAIKLTPDHAPAHNNLGNALSSQGRHREAEEAYRQAIKLQPDFALAAHTNLGCDLSSQGRHKEAEEACRQAIKLTPDHAPAHLNLGVALSGQGGRHQEAENAYRMAIKLQPDLVDAHFNLGNILSGLNRSQDGTRSFASNSGSSSNLGQRRSTRATGSRLMRPM